MMRESSHAQLNGVLDRLVDQVHFFGVVVGVAPALHESGYTKRGAAFVGGPRAFLDRHGAESAKGGGALERSRGTDAEDTHEIFRVNERSNVSQAGQNTTSEGDGRGLGDSERVLFARRGLLNEVRPGG